MKNSSTKLWLAIGLIVLGVIAIFSSHHYTYPHDEIVIESSPPIWNRVFGGAVVHEWSVRGDSGYLQSAELLLIVGLLLLLFGAATFFIEFMKKKR